MADDTIETAERLFGETPRWPMWFPSKLKHATDMDHHTLESWKQVVGEACVPSVAVMWDNRSNTCLRAQRITDEMLQHVVYLPESETSKASFDWFLFLEFLR
jgi:hypothetical protein